MKFDITNFLQPPTTELSHFLAGDNQLVVCNGVNPSYKLGKIIKDTGYSLVGTALQPNKKITGLFNFRQSSTINKMLATIDNATSDDTQLFYSTGSAWTEIAAAETAWANKAGINVEMESFIGYCFFVGYGATDGFLPPRSLTGTTFGTTNTTSMPGAKYIKRYRDRLYLGNCDISATAYPYRVYFSSVPVAGAITWNVASDYIDVDFSEEITGFGENWDRFIIFTEFSAYVYDQASRKKVWDIGCANNKTIKNSGAHMIWANTSNVYASTGGMPIEIGNDIIELIQNSDPTKWSAEEDNEEYILYLGNTSANKITYTNCIATLNIRTGMWRWRELNDEVSIIANYTPASTDILFLGTSAGQVMQKSKYTDTTPVYSDNGKPIRAHFRTKAYDFGSPSIIKTIKEVVAYSEYGINLQIRYRIFDENQEIKIPFEDIGTLNKVVNKFMQPALMTREGKSLKGNFIQFEFSEYSTNKPFEFFGFTVDVISDQDKKNVQQ